MSPKSLPIALLITALMPAVASADGLPVPVENAGPSGVVSPDGHTRYVTVSTRGGTLVERIDTRGGRVLEWRFLRGDFTIPVVALDGTAQGLSHDGRTLVLIRPRQGFPRSLTTLAVIDTRTLRVRRGIGLRGDFSFDALSPDGRRIFLVNYIDGRNPNRYRVRTLDTATGALDPKPVVDPDESPEEMRGLPLTRTSSADGRWHYTLYDGGGKHPFVHALDVQAKRAKCIDLPAFPREVDPTSMRLSLLAGGRTLRVASLTSGDTSATVDTRSFEVTAGAGPTPAAPGGEAGSGASAAPWIAGAGFVLLASGLGLSIRSRRRARTRPRSAASQP
jgi:DNA-binding beta-propeller fold protein YncE